jgi:hypothetical protein
MTVNHPPLLAEDGATFHARIAPIPDGKFQASCHAELDLKSSLLQESSIYGTFISRHDAHVWVHQQAAVRNFPRILWADEFSAEEV